MVAETILLAPAATAPRPVTVTVVNVDGIARLTEPSRVPELIDAGKFFWIDIVGADEAARMDFLDELRFDRADLAWVQRFGQTGRMVIARQRLRAVTWLSERPGSGLTEIHVLASRNCVLTLWDGDAAVLDEIREHYAERAAELEKSPQEAVAILLQLLLGTLHNAISEVDARIQALRTQIRQEPNSVDFASLTDRLQRLQSAWSDIDRYSSAVRTAIIGVEALPGIDESGARELNDYADQVEDLEHRLQERARWGMDILQDYATAIAQRQGEQINRLTMVSLIFLPITFLTGFFAMNFNWMIDALRSPQAFVGLGLFLPALSVVLIVLWLKRKGLI
jgi:magnesium transporter